MGKFGRQAFPAGAAAVSGVDAETGMVAAASDPAPSSGYEGWRRQRHKADVVGRAWRARDRRGPAEPAA